MLGTEGARACAHGLTSSYCETQNDGLFKVCVFVSTLLGTVRVASPKAVGRRNRRTAPLSCVCGRALGRLALGRCCLRTN